MAKYNGINHLAMVTDDMDKTIRFWRDLLGLRLVAGVGQEGFRHYFFEISETDLLAFFEWKGAKNIPAKDHGSPVKTPMAFDHVSIGVESFEDLKEIKLKLLAAGFWVSEIVDHGFIHSIYSFDPNNIPIEFSYNLPEVDIRKTPRMKDRKPSNIALEGSDPIPGKWPEPDPGAKEKEDFTVYPGPGKSLGDS